MKRVAVIGAAGLLGQYLVSEAVDRGYEVLGTYRNTVVSGSGFRVEHLDMVDREETEKVLRGFAPDMVILSSAITNVDYCETHPSEAWAVNVEGTLNVAQACKLIKARLMYISTDYVFNGAKGERYYEFETPDPLSVYSQTKLEGERLTLDAEHHNLVCRVSVMYGWNRASSKANFVTWVIDSLRRKEEVGLFGDQFVSPTYAPHCAGVLLTLAEAPAFGIYHTSGPDCIDRYTMGMKVAEVFGLDKSFIKKVRTEDLPMPARRGKVLCLDVTKAEAEFNLQMLPFAQGLEDMRSREGKGV